MMKKKTSLTYKFSSLFIGCIAILLCLITLSGCSDTTSTLKATVGENSKVYKISEIGYWEKKEYNFKDAENKSLDLYAKIIPTWKIVANINGEEFGSDFSALTIICEDGTTKTYKQSDTVSDEWEGGTLQSDFLVYNEEEETLSYLHFDPFSESMNHVEEMFDNVVEIIFEV